jgi:hypothetical protein
MRKITYVKSQNSGALCADDWATLERLLKFTISEQGKDGGDQAIFIQFRYAPNIIEVELAYTV